MKTIASVILVVVLAFGAGCTHPDWIERTLVTVDVTGTWQGTGVNGTPYTFDLKQEGPKVTGSIQYRAIVTPFDPPGPVTGTVAGDVFSFKQTNASLSGTMTVSGDEMSGALHVPGRGPQTFNLRRVNSSAPPSSPKP